MDSMIPPAVVAQILKLPKLPIPDLRALWRTLYGTEAPTHHRQFLERRIAYRLQEDEARKTDAAGLDRNRQRIDVLIETSARKARSAALALRPGTVLLREYHGVEHQVRVRSEGGFEYQGRPYRSLTVIAAEITGSRWSGPLFFGLKARSRRGRARQ